MRLRRLPRRVRAQPGIDLQQRFADGGRDEQVAADLVDALAARLAARRRRAPTGPSSCSHSANFARPVLGGQTRPAEDDLQQRLGD